MTKPTKWYQTRKKIKLKRIERRIEQRKYKTKRDVRNALNSLYKARLKINITKSEKIFGNYLEDQGIEFKFQKGFFNPFHIIADFFIPDKKLIIEIDGGYHNSSKQKEKDRRRDNAFLRVRGIRTLRITNKEVNKGDFVSRLEKALDQELKYFVKPKRIKRKKTKKKKKKKKNRDYSYLHKYEGYDWDDNRNYSVAIQKQREETERVKRLRELKLSKQE